MPFHFQCPSQLLLEFVTNIVHIILKLQTQQWELTWIFDPINSAALCGYVPKEGKHLLDCISLNICIWVVFFLQLHLKQHNKNIYQRQISISQQDNEFSSAIFIAFEMSLSNPLQSSTRIMKNKVKFKDQLFISLCIKWDLPCKDL